MTEKELAQLLKKTRRRPKFSLSTNGKVKPIGTSILDSPTTTKYKNKKVVYMGITFDSQLEADRYGQLILMQRVKEITELRRQVSYELIPSQREPSTVGPRGGVKLGKVIEQAVNYVADFVYKDKCGNTVVEDTKGVKTADYIIKRKLMLYIHKIRITEITE
ncbi:MAG: DUF1064 domain-containing protein [Clostridia bacterium]|nr:DUF1064 domain-containing protein [Clostridia bacterium]